MYPPLNILLQSPNLTPTWTPACAGVTVKWETERVFPQPVKRGATTRRFQGLSVHPFVRFRKSGADKIKPVAGAMERVFLHRSILKRQWQRLAAPSLAA